MTTTTWVLVLAAAFVVWYMVDGVLMARRVGGLVDVYESSDDPAVWAEGQALLRQVGSRRKLMVATALFWPRTVFVLIRNHREVSGG